MTGGARVVANESSKAGLKEEGLDGVSEAVE